MTRRAAIIAVVAVLAACNATTQPGSTTTTTAPVATVADPTTSTTEVVLGPVDICEGASVRWEIDAAHSASCFLAEIEIAPPIEGWQSTHANLDAIEGQWVAEGDRQPGIRFVAVADQPDLSAAEVIDVILAIEGVDARQPPNPLADTIQVDVDTAPDPSILSDLRETECARASRALNLAGGEPGYILLDRVSLAEADLGRLYGLGACRTFRIWAIPIAGTTITVIATVDDLDRFDELMPMMDDLVATVSVAGR